MEQISGKIHGAVNTAKEGTSTAPSKTTSCPFKQCDGSGWIPVTVNGASALSECQCLLSPIRRLKAERLFNSSGIPRRFAQKTFAAFDAKQQPKPFSLAKRYAEQFETIRNTEKNGLCFIGPTGTGKTHLSYAILNELIKLSVTPLAVVVPELLDALRPKSGITRDETDKKNSEVEERIRMLKTVDIVLLDDLGAERDSGWVAERLYLIINARYTNMLPTIITSNLTLEEMEQSLQWERIVSRIIEMCYIIPVDGDDYRKTGRKE